MANYVVDIQFYIDDTNGERFSFGDITQAYDVVSNKYSNENNRRLAASIMLLNKEVIRLSEQFAIKSDTTGIENTVFQDLGKIIDSRKLLIKSLQDQIENENTMVTGGFAIKNRRTFLRGIND